MPKQSGIPPTPQSDSQSTIKDGGHEAGVLDISSTMFIRAVESS